MPAARTRRGATTVVRGFAAITGHQRAITILRAQRAAGRLAHAYCLIGEEGVGKTAVARALAEELLLGEGQPSRLEVHPDFWCDDRPEAISIDEIRFHPERGAPAHDQSLQQFLSLKPFVAPLRLALLAFEDADGVLSFAARFGQGPQAEMRVVASDALRGFTAFLRDAMLLRAGLLRPMPPARQASLEAWIARVSADHVQATLAAA